MVLKRKDKRKKMKSLILDGIFLFSPMVLALFGIIYLSIKEKKKKRKSC